LPGEIGTFTIYNVTFAAYSAAWPIAVYLQQNGSTERSRGVVMLKEELDKTSKEETIKTSDKDETQVDSRIDR